MSRQLGLVFMLFLAPAPSAPARAEEPKAVFYRGVNFNGPSVTIDGNAWQAGDSPDFECQDSKFENQAVTLVPPTDVDRAKMIRSSVWSRSGDNKLVIHKVEAGRYRVFLYVWEDNNSETFDVLLDGKPVLKAFKSGATGEWHKLGPWEIDVRDGTIRLGSHGGAANYSGVEIWRLDGAGSTPAPRPTAARAVRTIDPNDPLARTTDTRAGYDWWSLQPVTRPEPPSLAPEDSASGRRRPAGWPANAVDKFVLAKLEEHGLEPSLAADRATLIRRVSFDLIGLPPTPEEVDAFVSDASADAYVRLVDRLLDSPHYGERWARHWLDIVRFGESQGFERNKLRPNAWRYRDWVVEALNSDMPYDEFVRLQLAGDVLRPDDPLAVIASGFLVAGPFDQTAYTDGTASMKAAAREEELEGLVGTVGQTFLGLSINCARCHDHKFDPIRQREYFQIAAALGGTYHNYQSERESLSPAGKAALAPRIESLNREMAALRERIALSKTARRRRELELELSRKESLVRLLSGGPAHVTAPKEPGVFHVLARGDIRQKGEPVSASGLTCIDGAATEWNLAPDAPEAARRVALARWITDPTNPLFARVIANRVWAYHFGSGLVATPSDFGFGGGRPSHPELLDWLASELIAPEQGPAWSLKHLHRTILLSATYQQASGLASPSSFAGASGFNDPAPLKPEARAKATEHDPENRLLWRRAPQRLEAETVRDAVLAISGELNPAMAGPGYRDFTSRSASQNEIYEVIDASGSEFNRRSIYRTWIRSGTSPFLDVLDCPDPSVATPRRNATTTPLQALTLLNSGFMERNAAAWAGRLARHAPDDVREQIRRAHREAFARTVTPEEEAFAARFVAEHGLAQFCLVLFNANEFLYVE
jgi:hypothetical protein